MPGIPPAFLNSVTSVIPARRQARRVYVCSRAAESMFASASAPSNCRAVTRELGSLQFY